MARQEQFDGTGRVTGFYTIEDPDGRKRLVKYVADEHGFRASVVTNEQGKPIRTASVLVIDDVIGSRWGMMVDASLMEGTLRIYRISSSV